MGAAGLGGLGRLGRWEVWCRHGDNRVARRLDRLQEKRATHGNKNAALEHRHSIIFIPRLREKLIGGVRIGGDEARYSSRNEHVLVPYADSLAVLHTRKDFKPFRGFLGQMRFVKHNRVAGLDADPTELVDRINEIVRPTFGYANGTEQFRLPAPGSPIKR